MSDQGRESELVEEREGIQLLRRPEGWVVKKENGRELGPYRQATAKNYLYLFSKAKRDLPRKIYEKIEMPQDKTIICPRCSNIAVVLGRTREEKYVVKCERDGAFLIEPLQEVRARREYRKKSTYRIDAGT
ncbi:unnamed protein product [marine sediment metagenome]|uniref:Uncharacterized protein n=1 Tax=marine sediment metagenome TaxID=412755 RepID=X1KL50_9ZZZZ